MDLLPKWRRPFQAMPLQPVRQFAALAGTRLHLLERGTARLTGRQFALEALQLALRLFADAFKLWQLVL